MKESKGEQEICCIRLASSIFSFIQVPFPFPRHFLAGQEFTDACNSIQLRAGRWIRRLNGNEWFVRNILPWMMWFPDVIRCDVKKDESNKKTMEGLFIGVLHASSCLTSWVKILKLMKTILCYSIPRWKSFSAGDRSKIHHTDLIHSSSSQTTCLFSTCCELSVDDVILFYLPTLLEHLACFQKPQRQSLRNKNVKHQMLIRKQQLSSVFPWNWKRLCSFRLPFTTRH